LFLSLLSPSLPHNCSAKATRRKKKRGAWNLEETRKGGEGKGCVKEKVQKKNETRRVERERNKTIFK
jgi:hypothetical protein